MSVEGRDEILLPDRAEQRPVRRVERRADAGVAANARLTATNAAVLLVLLAAEGVTILRVRALRDVTGAAKRQWLIAASLVAGAMLGFLLLSHVGHWMAVRPGG